jgi:hypothetical protein
MSLISFLLEQGCDSMSPYSLFRYHSLVSTSISLKLRFAQFQQDRAE